jgi:hypothetical protein
MGSDQGAGCHPGGGDGQRPGNRDDVSLPQNKVIRLAGEGDLWATEVENKNTRFKKLNFKPDFRFTHPGSSRNDPIFYPYFGFFELWN